jgi:zinc transport system substrate-binding protein
MRRIYTIAIEMIALILLLSLTACGQSPSNQSDGKINVVTSFYPLYFLASEIGGEDAHVVNLLSAGVEPHDWTPKSQDITHASKAQIFLYNGAGLEGWVDNFKNALTSHKGTLLVEASKGIPLLRGNNDEDVLADNHDKSNIDPHTWVSPKSIITMATTVKEAFVTKDPAHEAGYTRRYDSLKLKLERLDAEFQQILSSLPKRDIVVSHQAFGYLCRDYGLKQVPIMGLSPEAEPRAQDLLKIANFVKENGVTTIFFEELVSDRLARTLAHEVNVKTAVLNPLEGLTPAQEKAGDNYFTLMERNLQNLRQALQ